MGFLSDQCPTCGEKVRIGANFCPHCGAEAPKGKVSCRRCGSTIRAASKFCLKCGAPVATPEKKAERENRWVRTEEEFARRIDVVNVEAMLKQGVIVEQGTRALLFVDGALVQELGAGRYDMESADAQKLVEIGPPKTMTVIALDAGDVSLSFSFSDLFTKDPLKIAVDSTMSLAVTDPTRFFTNVMKARQSFALAELRATLFDELQDALAECVDGVSAFDLNSNLSLKREFEATIEQHMGRTFERDGFGRFQVRTFRYRHKELDEQRQLKEELLLQATEQEAKNEGMSRLFDARSEADVQKIVEETKKVENFEKRAEIFSRMRRAVNSNKFDEVKSKEELASFLRDVHFRQRREKLVKEEEIQELERDFTERREDRDLQRKYLTTKLQMERQLELERTEAIQREDLTADLLERRLNLRRTVLEADLANEWAKSMHDLELTKRQHLAQLEANLKSAQSEAEIEKTKLEIQRGKVDLGMYARERKNAVDLAKVREEQKIQLEGEMQRLEMQQKAEDAAHRREMERMDKLAQMGAEALIAVTDDTERAALLAQLKSTETMKDMTEEQILALAAKDSDAVAAALAEKYKGMSSDKLEQMYERMMQIQRESTDRDRESAKEVRETLERLAEKAMDSQTAVAQAQLASEKAKGEKVETVQQQAMDRVADVAAEKARAAGPATVTPLQEQLVSCPGCKKRVPAGSKFCEHCGCEFKD